jgi:hypothetical protein
MRLLLRLFSEKGCKTRLRGVSRRRVQRPSSPLGNYLLVIGGGMRVQLWHVCKLSLNCGASSTLRQTVRIYTLRLLLL